MRCNDCNKFVGLDLGDAEIQSGPDIDESGNITCEARIVRNCADCLPKRLSGQTGNQIRHRAIAGRSLASALTLR